MSTRTFTYSGPPTSVTITDQDGKATFESSLVSGRAYDLPEGSSLVEAWLDQGLLVKSPQGVETKPPHEEKAEPKGKSPAKSKGDTQ